jgi:nitrate reductase gamma subunit
VAVPKGQPGSSEVSAECLKASLLEIVEGAICFVGLTILLHRRIFDPRIRLTSHRTDLFILVILWVQLVLGLVTLPFSFAGRADAHEMLILASWAQGIVTFQPDALPLVAVAWPFKVHMVLGMTIFLLFPFSRLVHVWSGFGSIAYLFRPYQVVRSRRLNLPAGHNTPPTRV